MTSFSRDLRLTHLITGLNTGGAETMLFKLCRVWAGQGVRLEVISMIGGGVLADRFRDLGIPVVELGMRSGAPNPLALGRLMLQLADHRPQVFQTWMYHADLMGGLAARLMGHPFPVTWNIRNSDLGPSFTKGSTRLVARVCAGMGARWVDRIFCCSDRSATLHEEFGYSKDLFCVLPNGFEMERFHADSQARAVVRAELGLSDDLRLVGQVARYDPIKGHGVMLEALTLLPSQVHLLLCGDGVTAENRALRDAMNRLGVQERCHLLGRRSDIPRLMSALDFLVSPSLGEGFPNVVGEAMACEIPCVVTDVGDSLLIVGGHGWVVPPGDAASLARALNEAIALPDARRRELGVQARAYIAEKFDIQRVADRYLSEYASILDCSVL